MTALGDSLSLLLITCDDHLTRLSGGRHQTPSNLKQFPGSRVTLSILDCVPHLFDFLSCKKLSHSRVHKRVSQLDMCIRFGILTLRHAQTSPTLIRWQETFCAEGVDGVSTPKPSYQLRKVRSTAWSRPSHLSSSFIC